MDFETFDKQLLNELELIGALGVKTDTSKNVILTNSLLSDQSTLVIQNLQTRIHEI